MLFILCPYCGARSELEFSYAGEAHRPRPAAPETLSDEAWADFLFYRANPKGLHMERWRHVHGCAKFFNVLRDTKSDRILATYRIGESPPALETSTTTEAGS